MAPSPWAGQGPGQPRSTEGTGRSPWFSRARKAPREYVRPRSFGTRTITACAQAPRYKCMPTSRSFDAAEPLLHVAAPEEKSARDSTAADHHTSTRILSNKTGQSVLARPAGARVPSSLFGATALAMIWHTVSSKCSSICESSRPRFQSPTIPHERTYGVSHT